MNAPGDIQSSNPDSKALIAPKYVAVIFIAMGIFALGLGIRAFYDRSAGHTKPLDPTEFGTLLAGTIGTGAAVATALFVIATLWYQGAEFTAHVAAMNASVAQQATHANTAKEALRRERSQAAFSAIVSLLPELRSLAEKIPQQDFDDCTRKFDIHKDACTAQLEKQRSLRPDHVTAIVAFLDNCRHLLPNVETLRETHLLFNKLRDIDLEHDTLGVQDMKANLDAIWNQLSFKTSELDRRRDLLKGMIKWCEDQVDKP